MEEAVKNLKKTLRIYIFFPWQSQRLAWLAYVQKDDSSQVGA
jgi:hypothetical protein